MPVHDYVIVGECDDGPLGQLESAVVGRSQSASILSCVADARLSAMPYEICGVIGDRIIVDDNHLVVRVLQTR